MGKEPRNKRREALVGSKIAIATCSEAPTMSRTLHLVAKSVPGYGPPDGRCLPCSGVSGKAVSATPRLLSHCDLIIRSQLKIGTLPWAPKRAFLGCKASSSGNRRNSDFSRQNQGGFSRGRNRKNKEKESFDNFEEPELSNNSNTPSYQATGTPGAKEREIIGLFKKVQAQLRERAAGKKEEKKVEASKEQSKESKSVESILQVLRKHAADSGKGSKGRIRDNVDKSAPNGVASNGVATSSYGSRKDGDTASRAPSKFVRRSPIPRENNSSQGDSGRSSRWTSSDTRKKHLDDILAEPEEEEPEMELILEKNMSSGGDATFKSRSTLNGTKKNSLHDLIPDLEESDSDSDSDLDLVSEFEPELELEAKHGSEAVFSAEVPEVGDKQEVMEEVDLKSLKVPELRAMAKSRGHEKISKMKKAELIDLLSRS